MSQTQTDPANSSKQAPSIPVKEEQILTPQPKTSQPQPPPQKPKRRIPKLLLILGAIALFAGVGYGVYRLFFYQPEPEGLFLSGRIEGYETDISAKIGGRIADVYVREGDVVKPNQRFVRQSSTYICYLKESNYHFHQLLHISFNIIITVKILCKPAYY